jgi:hypothetical protein
MTQTEFRTYDVAADDFTIVVTASTDAAALPDIAPFAFTPKDATTGSPTKRDGSFTGKGNTSSLSIAAPSSPSDISFTFQVRFPASNPVDKPLKLTFLAKSGQSVLDQILPADLPIVFANYVMHFR